MKRRRVSVFSLSFLDCICCGLGAVILLFVVVNAKSALRRDEVTVDLRAKVTRLEHEVLEEKKGLIELRNTLDDTNQQWVTAQGLSEQLIQTARQSEKELAHYENETLASKAHINQLKADLKSLEEDVKRLRAGAQAQEDYGDRLRTFPGEGDRQYLTDLKLGGRRIFILVDASASMLGETIVEIIRRRNLDNSEKLRSAKWKQAVATVEWLTANLPITSQYQLYAFNETAVPVLPSTQGVWLDAAHVDVLNQAVAALHDVIPQKGTSLRNAFQSMTDMSPVPDNIFLLTDSLPTMGADKPRQTRVSGNKRLRLFHEAIRKLPPNVPVNIILFPMEGDPAASSVFWRLAYDTKGSLLCPSKDWP
jgi:hypothetical protein